MNQTDTEATRQERKDLAARVRKRRGLAVLSLLSGIPALVLVGHFGGKELAMVATFALLFGAAMVSGIGLLTLQCPRCRHPLLWDEKRGMQGLTWLLADRCGHCGSRWAGGD